jgi:putative membrane protein
MNARWRGGKQCLAHPADGRAIGYLAMGYLAMGYLWLKALHIAAILIWIGGLLIAAVTIGALSLSKGAAEATGRTAVLHVVRWDQRVTLPAMLLVWGAGLTLAIQGEWFRSPWLIIKLVLVLALSALHGVLSGTLRKIGYSDGPSTPSSLRHAPLLIVISTVAIVVLVVVKPF